jgi:DNA-binding transcriptional LysR family regulator
MFQNLDVDVLKTFLAIADTGSFTRAGEQVHKTQSAVSMQMKRLEEVVGRPIFVRDGRASRITADGERLIEYARRMAALNDETMSAFTKPDLVGTVRFGTPDDYADHFLPEILARFARSHPMVAVDVECHMSGALHRKVKQGEVDLALVTLGCEVQSDELVRREKLLWVTSMRHHVHMAEILPLAVSQTGCEWRGIVLDALAGAKRKYRIAYSSHNSNAVSAAVLQGLAVGAMPGVCLRPGMRVLTEKDGFPPLEDFGIGLLRKAGRSSGAIDALARHVTEAFSNPSANAFAAA